MYPSRGQEDRPRRTLGGSGEVDRKTSTVDAVKVRVGPLAEETPQLANYDAKTRQLV